MKLKSAVLMLLLASAILLAQSCNSRKWDGYGAEDLKKYITVAEYKGLTAVLSPAEVTEDEIDTEISKILSSDIKRIEITDGIENGDEVTITAYCIVDGESYPELSYENVTYTVGSEEKGSIQSYFSTVITSMKKGDTADYKIILPAGMIEGKSGDYAVVYRVTVLYTYRTIYPTLDNRTAERLIPGCGGVSGLRNLIKKDLTAVKLKAAENRASKELFDRVVAESTVISLPYSVYGEKYSELCSVYEENAENLSMSLEKYLGQYYGMTVSEFEKSMAEKATALTKESFIVRIIAEEEKITCTDEELTAFAARCALESGGIYGSADDYIAAFGEDSVMEQYLRESVISVIFGAAVKDGIDSAE